MAQDTHGEGLRAAHRLYEIVKDDDAARKLVLKMQRSIRSLQRRLVFAESQKRAELDALRAELHGELVDREANAARIWDRQKYLFERAEALSGMSSAHQRAAASAAYLEAALVTLDPTPTPHAVDSKVLHAQSANELKE